MKYIDLIEQIPKIDKEAMENYVFRYGVASSFIGLDKWLQNWSHSKQTLYRLLGNSLIKEFPYKYEKDDVLFHDEIEEFIYKSHFKSSYHEFYITIIKPAYEAKKMSDEIRLAFSRLSDVSNFYDDKIKYGLKYKRADKKNTLQLQPGMKPIRAFSKVIEYFKDIFNFEGFEDFRIGHSMLLNDKITKGTLCISIHPLDFITMSDNTLNWSSCMSWMDQGCYHQGTVEMMNSNNVVCCYLKAKDSFYFDKKNLIKTPEWSWNNKKWRVLGYVTKDILMCGKAYPYRNDNHSKEVLSHLRDLAKENLGWHYSFGPELYKDMIHINNNNQMEKNRVWIRTKEANKHNILFDTKGMYNDMLNDHYTKYWCYRNKVNHNKIISVSGKSVCLCCGSSVIDYNYDSDWDGEYNERFSGCGDIICEPCTKYFVCDCCCITDTTQKHYNVNINDHIYTLCEFCYNYLLKKCPCCGKPFFIKGFSNYVGIIDTRKDTKYLDDVWDIDTLSCTKRKEIIDILTRKKIIDPELFSVYVCPDCVSKKQHLFTIESESFATRWSHGKNIIYRDVVKNEPNPQRLFFVNYEDVENKDSLLISLE